MNDDGKLSPGIPQRTIDDLGRVGGPFVGRLYLWGDDGPVLEGIGQAEANRPYFDAESIAVGFTEPEAPRRLDGVMRIDCDAIPDRVMPRLGDVVSLDVGQERIRVLLASFADRTKAVGPPINPSRIGDIEIEFRSYGKPGPAAVVGSWLSRPPLL